MKEIERFYKAIDEEQIMILATSAKGSVTMRVVSPVLFDKSILFFTSSASKKYQQLKTNPNCCISVGGIFAEAKAEILGATMDSACEKQRAAYCAKFPNAFDEGIDFGGRYDDFVLLKPVKISGWSFGDLPNADGMPSIPFEINLSKEL